MSSKPSKQKIDRGNKSINFRADLDDDLKVEYDKSFASAYRLEILMIQLLRVMKKK